MPAITIHFTFLFYVFVLNAILFFFFCPFILILVVVFFLLVFTYSLFSEQNLGGHREECRLEGLGDANVWLTDLMGSS